MPWHTTGYRMDAKPHIDARCTQVFGNLVHRMLCLSHRHAIARNDDHVLRIPQQFGGFSGRDRRHFANRLTAIGRLCRCAAIRTKTAGDDAEEVAVHGAAHDVGQNRTARTDQCPGHNQQVITEHEARRCCRPT